MHLVGRVLREGWEVKSLKEIGETQTGNTPATKEKDNYGNHIPFVKPAHFKTDGSIDAKDSGLSEKGLKSARLFKANSILMVCIGATIGKTGFSEIAVTSNQQINAFTPPKEFEAKFFYYLFITDDFQNKIIQNSAQATLPIINKSKWENLLVSFPKKKEEQQKIVAILDEAFGAIEKAKANAELNLKNAKELFENYLQSVFENKGEGWEEKTLNDVCEITSKLIDPKKEEFQNLIHIGAGNIESQKGTLIDLKTAKEENLISGKFLFDETMVLYSKIRPYLMKVVRCDFQGLCSADIYPLVPIKNKMSQDFLYHLLLSSHFTEYAIVGSQRAGMPKVNRKHLFEYTFYCPPIQEQQTIVKKLDTLSEQTKKLEKIYQQKIKDLDELKKSILQKAFNGELS